MSLRDKWLSTAAVLAMLVLNWMPVLDRMAEDYVSGASGDGFRMFAAAKGLNAAISVAQSFEVGVGFSLAPFEFLDPINDLVERFSGFILYGLAALGLQKLLLVASSALWLKLVFSLILLGALVGCWMRAALPVFLLRVIALLLLLRFALLLQVGVSWTLDQSYFTERQEVAVATLDDSSSQVLDARARYLDGRGEGSWWDGVKSVFSYQVPAAQQEELGQDTSEAIVDLIVIMLVRSILLPLVVIWLVLRTARSLWPA